MNANSLDILIVGSGRSGTSLLAGCLDSHPEICLEHELGSIPFLMGQAFKGDKKEAELCHIDNMIDMFLHECNERANSEPKPIFGNKVTTEQLMGLHKHNRFHPQEKIDVDDYFFNRRMPGVKTVFIFRNGRDVVRSKIKRKGAAADESAGRWNYAVNMYKNLLAKKNELYAVRYEELVNSPELTMRQLCRFIGVEYSDSMLSGPSNKKIANNYRQEGFNTLRANNKESHIDPAAEALIAENMRYLGYSIPP